MRAAAVVTPKLLTAVMMGDVASGTNAVVKVKSADIATFPAASVERTRKWYKVLGLSPVSGCEWTSTKLGSKAVRLPYAVVVPYSTWLSDGSFVVQLMIAPVVIIPELLTAEMTGGVVSGSGNVVNVKSNDTAIFPAASLDCAL